MKNLAFRLGVGLLCLVPFLMLLFVGDRLGYQRAQLEFAAAAKKSEAEQRYIEETRRKAQQENANEGLRIAAADAARQLSAARAAGAADERLRLARQAVRDRNREPGSSPTAALQCTTDTATLTELLGACSSAYRQLGLDADRELDEARRRGNECAANYDSLIPTLPQEKEADERDV